MIEFGKLIVDNRPEIEPFYDDVSMGGGFIEFSCSCCKTSVSKETFYFLTDDAQPNKEQKEALNNFFSIEKEPYFRHSPNVGLMKCPSCQAQHAVYISGGEVQMGRYQTALIAVAECKV